jgi:ABC-type Na+ transport system ATPase subunit NatA
MYLATIRGVNQKTHIDQLIVEAPRRLFVDEANICLDLNSHSVVRCDHLEFIR